MTEAVNQFQHGVLDRIHAFPGTAWPDYFGLLQADDGYRQRIVIGVARAAHRRRYASLSQAFSVTDRQVLAAAMTKVREDF